MNKIISHIILSGCLLLPFEAKAAMVEASDSIDAEHKLNDVVVKAAKNSRSLSRVESVDIIGKDQLIRAACCNLGESFSANPSVDVSYSDAATGARQIKLLGLSGTYVQMMTENVPNLRGASIPYSLGYVPGPWMQSIQVSKGASSVKNGYESITGQINIEYAKPQATDGFRTNAYLDSDLKQEVNLDGSIHLNDRLSTSLLLHFENRQTEHDGNHDGFMDMPKVRQFNAMHRWAYVSPVWISQLYLRALRDERNGGQSAHHINKSVSPYTTSVETDRYEVQWKNGFTLNADHNTSVALMLHGSWHDAWNSFGNNKYDVLQKNGYAQLMFETDFSEEHNLSLGASINHDYYSTRLKPPSLYRETYWVKSSETTAGIYAQYTYKLCDLLTIMPGVRLDHSDVYGTFFTPRLHVKYSPYEFLTLRASVGKGYRSPHALAENNHLLSRGRGIDLQSYFTTNLKQEEAWNTGFSAGLNIPVMGKNLEINAEYYYTDFINQMVINFHDGLSALSFENLNGKSYSHTLQVDATYPFFEGFTATTAYRLNDVKCTYDGILHQKPLTSRYKGLLTLSYKTPMELWQFDVTGQLNGGGELYDHSKYPSYFQLQAQVTREFQYFSVYLGGENLTSYKMKNPIIDAHNPWSDTFDSTQIWGPVTGAMAYIGIRIKFEKL